MKLPKIIIRKDDGEKFVLNENEKYELEMMLKYKKMGHLINEHTFESLNNKKFRHVYEDGA